MVEEDGFIIEVPRVHTMVTKQDDAAMDAESIGTDGLGPCISFIMHFDRHQKEFAILHHYTYHDDKENTTELDDVMSILSFINGLFEDFVMKYETEKELLEELINNLFLIVTGGDVYQGAAIRKACFNIYKNVFNLDRMKSIKKNFLFLYKQLKSNVLVINPVVKIDPVTDCGGQF